MSRLGGGMVCIASPDIIRIGHQKGRQGVGARRPCVLRRREDRLPAFAFLCLCGRRTLFGFARGNLPSDGSNNEIWSQGYSVATFHNIRSANPRSPNHFRFVRAFNALQLSGQMS